ncbi:hypothetical protein [Streptomyces sp. NPDC054834]
MLGDQGQDGVVVNKRATSRLKEAGLFGSSSAPATASDSAKYSTAAAIRPDPSGARTGIR